MAVVALQATCSSLLHECYREVEQAMRTAEDVKGKGVGEAPHKSIDVAVHEE